MKNIVIKNTMKIKVNDNLTNIFNYIDSQLTEFSFKDLVQYVLDYDLYQEFYLNQQIIFKLYEEKNRLFKERKDEKTITDML